MGYSILWIMMLHFTFIQVKPLGFVAQYGFAGVEIFMMVSGFGLFFSLEKDASLKHFYKKRLLRIFPTYYILGISGVCCSSTTTFGSTCFVIARLGSGQAGSTVTGSSRLSLRSTSLPLFLKRCLTSTFSGFWEAFVCSACCHRYGLLTKNNG